MTYDLTHLRDDALLRDLDALAAQDRTTTANLLAHIAEVDARRLYAPAGYSSMHANCVEKLHLSEGAAWKRIHLARKERVFPQLYLALAEGRVHLSGLTLLAAHLTAENVDVLIEASRHRRKAEIERMLAQRFPQVEALRLDEGISALAPSTPDRIPTAPVELSPGNVAPTTMAQGPAPTPESRVAPITAERYSLQVTIDRDTHDQLRYAQELLGHADRDVAQVLGRALNLLVAHLERQKFAVTDAPHKARESRARRTIPARVRRAVRERDGGACTFVGEEGHRCGSRRDLEFDHVIPLAHGGESTVENVRLVCRTHNQLEAERQFGREFMEAKRQAV